MHITELEQLFSLHPEVEVLTKELSKKGEKHFLLRNLFASAQSLMLHSLHKALEQKKHARNMLIVLDNPDDAQYMFADLRTLSNGKGVFFFPNSHRRRQGLDEAMAVQRTEVLTALISNSNTTSSIIVT